MQKQIYIFSGLGADERVFQYLDLSDYNVHFIKWIVPYGDEKIDEYAKRIIQQIKHPSPTLIGISFGGIMAIEVSKLIDTTKLIIMASVKSRKEIPFYYRLLGSLKMHNTLPLGLIKRSNVITNLLFGVSKLSDKEMLNNIMSDTDPNFFKWAINCIVKWESDVKDNSIIHIHGTRDRLFPICFIYPDYRIQNGGHLLPLSHPKEIMRILEQVL